MKKFSKDLKEHASKIIDYEKKKMIPLTTEEKIYRNKQKICYIYKKEFSNNEKKNYKVRDHCHYTGKYRGAADTICNLRYKVSKEIPIVFHNGSIYDYHFIIKELVKEYEGNFECLGENTEKYITFSVPICTNSFCNNDLDKFILLLRKGVYPYENMDNWERFNETSLPSKESFYSNLNMENIEDIDFRHGNNVFNKFKLNNLGDYHDLYVRSDTLLLAEVFEKDYQD